MPRFETVCFAADVSPGKSKIFDFDGQMVSLFNVEGQFMAISNACPHAGASLAHGTFDEEAVTCRIHHWRFCLRTGRYLDEDKPEFNARTFATRVVDGEVQVSLAPVEE